MKKSVALVLNFLLVAALLVNDAAAQSCSENTSVNGNAGTSFSNGTLGQSFTACQSGKLSSVSVQAGNASTGFNYVIAQIFSGDGFGGTLLATTAQVHVKANRTTTWGLTANDIDVVEGQKYTARFLTQSGTPMMAYGSSANAANDYYSRGRIHGAGQAHNDMFFSALIATLSDPVQSPVDDAVAVTRDSEVKLSFSRDMEALVGDITINNTTDATSETIDVTTLTIDGTDVLMPLSSPLEGGKDFEIIIPANILQSTNGISFPGLAAGEWTFSTSTSPFATLSTTSSDLTNEAVFPFSIEFSDAVTGFDLADFVITNGAASNLSGADASFTFDVTPSADGEVVVSLPTDVVEAGASNGNDSTGYSLVYDGTVPSVALSTDVASTIETGTFEMEVVFSEPVSGFESSDLVITNAEIVSSASTLDSLFTISLRALAQGQITVDLPADIADDLAGNANTAAPAIIDVTFSVDLASGVVSYYPFDGNANDTVSTGFNGTSTGTQLVTGFDGTADGAYSFDGLDQIVFGDTPIGAGSYSLGFWVKIPEGLGAETRVILEKRPACTEGRFFSIAYRNHATRGHEIVAGQRNNGGATSPIVSGLSVGEWMQVTYVKDNDNSSSSIYINGVQGSEVAWGAAYNFENSANLIAGSGPCVGADGSLGFAGDMDDLIIYDRALTAVEIDLLVPFAFKNASVASGGDILASDAIELNFNKNVSSSSVNSTNITTTASASGSVTANVTTENNQIVVSPPATGWPEDEDITISIFGLLAENGTALPATDLTYSVIEEESLGLILYYPISGNANEAIGEIAGQDGTISGALFVEGVDGDSFGALSFDGTDDVVTLGDAPISTESFSINTWIKVPADGSTTANTIILSKRAACTEGQMFNWYYQRSGDKIRFATNFRNGANAGGAATDFSFPVEEWMNVTMIKDNSTQKFRLLVNGVLEAESNWLSGSVNVENSAPIRLGATPCNGVNGEQRFDGLMDDIRIYDRVIDARILSIEPSKGTANASVDTVVTVTFDRVVDTSSLNASTISITDLDDVSYSYTTSFSNGDSVLTITPDNHLPRGKEIVVSIDTLSAQIGSYFLPFQTSFKTISSQLLSYSPSNGASNVDSVQTIAFKFDNEMDMSSLESGIKIVGSQHGTIEGDFTMPQTDSVVFTPSIPYFPNEMITVYVTSDLQDAGGESISNTRVFKFHAESGVFTNPTLSFELTKLTTSGTTPSPRVLIPADMDGDGDLDLVGGDDGSRRLLFFENLGSGNYGTGTSIAAGRGYFDVKVTDFDLDGDMDVVSVDRSVSQGLYWYENDGAGNFTEDLIVALTNTDTRSIAIADYNKDGMMDVAVASFGSNRFTVYQQDGTSLFAAANASQPIFLSEADWNGDGNMDIIAGNFGGSVVRWTNSGIGTFSGSGIHSAAQIRSVVPFDIDQDGDMDVVYSSQSGNQIGVLQNNGTGSFTNVQVGSVLGPHRLDVGDIDGDGDFDIVYTTAGTGADINFHYLENSGTLTLWTSQRLMPNETFSGAFTQTANFADLDNDGDLDVAATDAEGGFYVFENMIIDLNAAPIVTSPVADQTLAEDDSDGLVIDLSSVFTDNEGDTFTITAISDNDAVTAVVNGTNLEIDIATANFFGVVNITLTADDGNATNNDAFILTVTSVNDAPAFDLSVASITVDEDFTTTETITVTQNQPEGEDAPTYSIAPSVTFANISIDASTGEVTITAIADESGTQEFIITADDGASENNTATQTLTLTVNEVNDAPIVANLIADSAFDEDPTNNQTVDITSAFSDVDDANLTLGLNVISGSELANVSLTNGIVAIVPEADAFGTIQVEVTAEDAKGASVIDQFDIVINPINDAPSFTTSGDLTLTKNFTTTETVAVTADVIPFGEDNQVVTYSLSPASVNFANVSINQNTGDVAITAITDEFGSQEFIMTADDGQTANNTATQSFILIVVDNLAPVVENTIADASMDEDQATLSIVDVTTLFSDPESDPLTYLVSDDFEGSVTAILNGDFLEVTPAANFNGSGTVTVSASDANQTVSTSFILTINPLNDAPIVINSPVNQEATEDASYSFTLPADVFADVDGDAITITANVKPEWLSFDGSTFFGTPANADVGVEMIELEGSDSNGESAFVTFDLTIVNVNDAPEVVNTISDTSIDEDQATLSIVDLTTLFTDVDGDALTYSTSDDFNGSVAVSINSSNNFLEVTPSANYNGSGTITVSASDASEAVSTSFALTVISVNDDPTIEVTLSVQQATQDVSFSYTLPIGLFADVDGDNVTISVGAKPGWLSFDGTIFSGTPANEDVGVTSVEVIGSDGNGGIATATFDLTVTNVNDAPTVVTAIADVVVDEDSDVTTVSLSNVFEDVDAGDQLTLSVSAGESSLVSLTLNGETLDISYSADTSGTANVTLTATDGSGASVTDQFSVTVNSVNDAPVFDLSETAVSAQENFTEVVTVDILAGVVPADEADQTVTYSITSDDSDIVTATLNGSSIELSAITDAFGEQTFNVTANDGQTENNEHVVSFTVTVNQVLSAEGLESKLSIYPNPVAEYIMIDTNELVDLQFFGLNGQLIKTINQVNGKVDIADLKSGTYLMNVSNANEKITLRIQKTY